MPRWPWSRDAHETPGPEPEASALPSDGLTEAIVEVSPSVPASSAGGEGVQRAVAPAPAPAAPPEPRGLRSAGEIGLAMQGHDSVIDTMSQVGALGGLHQTAWIFAEGERMANENESELMAQRLVDRTAVRRSFEPDTFYDSLASLTSFREQGGFAEADGDLVLNDQFPATREATGTFPPMGSAATRGAGSQAPSFGQPPAERTVSRAVDAKFSDPAAPPAPSSGLVVDQGAFAAPAPAPKPPQPRAVARWASDPPPEARTPDMPVPPAAGGPAIQRLADRESSPQPQAGEPDSRDEPAPATEAPRAVVEPSHPANTAPELTLTEPAAGQATPDSGQEMHLQRHTPTSPEAAPLSVPPNAPPPSVPAAPPASAGPAATAAPPVPVEADAPILRTPADTAAPAPTVEATPGGVAHSFDGTLDLNVPVSEAVRAAEPTLQRNQERATPAVEPAPQSAAGALGSNGLVQAVSEPAPATIDPSTPVQRVSAEATGATTSATQDMPLVAPPPDDERGAATPGVARPSGASDAVQRSTAVPEAPAPPQSQPAAGTPTPAPAVAAIDQPATAAPAPPIQRHAGDEEEGAASGEGESRAEVARAVAEPGRPTAGSHDLDLPLADAAGRRDEASESAGEVRRTPAEGGRTAATRSPDSSTGGGAPLPGEVFRAADTAAPATPAAHLPVIPPVQSEQPAPIAHADATAGGAIARTPDLTLATEHSASGRATELVDGGAPTQRVEAAEAGPLPSADTVSEAPIARSIAPAVAEPSGLPLTPVAAEMPLQPPVTREEPAFGNDTLRPTHPDSPTQQTDSTASAAAQPPAAPPTGAPVQRTALPAEASAPPAMMRAPADLTLNEPRPPGPGRDAATGGTAHGPASPDRGRVDRTPDAAPPPVRADSTASPAPPAHGATPGGAVPTPAPAETASPQQAATPPVQRAVAQAGAPAEMPELDLAVPQPAEAGAGASLPPAAAGSTADATGAATPPVQRAVAQMGSPAGVPDLDLAIAQHAEMVGTEPSRGPDGTVLRTAGTAPEPTRPEPVPATASPAGTVPALPAMDLVQPTGAQEAGGATIRRRVETTTGPGTPSGGSSPTSRETPGVPPVAARPGAAVGGTPFTPPGGLELNTPISRSIDEGPDDLTPFEPVFATHGAAPAAPPPTLELATALPGTAGGNGSASGTSISRAIDRATAPPARPAPVQPQQTSQMERLEQPLFAAPQAAGSPEQVMRAYAQGAPAIGAGSSSREISNTASGELEFVERTVSARMEAFGAVTSVQREATEPAQDGANDLSPDQVKHLSEKVWQYVRRELRLERDRQRGRP